MSVVNAMNVLELLRLKSAPWYLLVTSAIVLCAVFAAANDLPVTAAAGQFLLGLGLPASVATGATNVHEWLVGEPRATGISWGIAVVSVIVGARFIRAVFNQRDATHDRRSAGGQVEHARTRQFSNEVHFESQEMKEERVKQAEKLYDREAKYDRAVNRFEQGVQMRAAAALALIIAIAIEWRGETWPEMDLGGVVTTLPVVLIVVGSATLVGILVVCGMREYSGPWDEPSRSEKLRTAFGAFVIEIAFVAVRLIAVMIALPGFLIGVLLYPAAPAKGDAAS